MNGKEFVEFHKATVLKMNDICKKKNQDYSGGGDSYAFNNFTMVEKMGISSTEQGFLTRMTDKLMRISNITKSGETAVKDESVKDTLMDLANYSILFMGYLESKKTIEPKDQQSPICDRIDCTKEFTHRTDHGKDVCFDHYMERVKDVNRESSPLGELCEHLLCFEPALINTFGIFRCNKHKHKKHPYEGS